MADDKPNWRAEMSESATSTYLSTHLISPTKKRTEGLAGAICRELILLDWSRLKGGSLMVKDGDKKWKHLIRRKS